MKRTKVIKVKKLMSWVELLRGVAFKHKIEPVYFQTRWGIHTFFVKEPIDIFICNNKLIVKVIKRSLNPWRMFFWNPRYKNIIEFPSTDNLTKTINLGDRVELTD